MRTTLIKVNDNLTVSKLAESKDYILCQNIENGEFVVWCKSIDNAFVNGFYTFSLTESLEYFNNRRFFETM